MIDESFRFMERFPMCNCGHSLKYHRGGALHFRDKPQKNFPMACSFETEYSACACNKFNNEKSRVK